MRFRRLFSLVARHWLLLLLAIALAAATAPWIVRWFRWSLPENNNLPEIVLRAGHSFPANAIAFDPKGRWFASGGADRRVKIWNPISGQLYRTLDGPKAAVIRLVASPDGQWLAAGCEDKEVLIWRVADGSQVRYFHSALTPDVAFTSDSRQVITGEKGDSRRIAFREISSGATVWHAMAFGPVIGFAVSPDGHHIVAANEGEIYVWHKPWLSALPRAAPLRFKHEAKKPERVAISGDGTRILIVVADKKTVHLIDAHTGMVVRSIQFQEEVWDATFAPDGKQFVVCAFREDHPISFFRSSDGSKAGGLGTPDRPYAALGFSRDGRTVGLAQFDGDLALLDVRSGKPRLVTARGGIGRLGAMAISRDGTRLAVASNYPTEDLAKIASSGGLSATAALGGNMIASVWDLTSGVPQRFLDRDAKSSSWMTLQLAFGADNSLLLVWECDVRVSPVRCHLAEWNLRENSLVRQMNEVPLDLWAFYAKAMSVSADGKLVAAPSGDGASLGIWDTSDGRLLRSFKDLPGKVMMVALSPAGEMLVAESAEFKLKSWNVQTGKLLYQENASIEATNLVAFEPHSRGIAFATWTSFLGDRSSLSIHSSISDNDPWIFDAGQRPLLTMAYSRDGDSLAVGDEGGDLIVYSLASKGKEPPSYQLRGHEGAVANASYLPHNNWLVSSAWDGTVRLWDLSKASLAATICPMTQHDWVVTTPEGLFDGSPGGYAHIAWRFNRDTFDIAPVEHFLREYYHPGLLADVLAGKNPKPPSALSGLDRRQPSIELSLKSVNPQATIATRYVKVRLVVNEAAPDRLHSQGSGLRDVRLFRNGVLVRLWRGEQKLNWFGRTTLDAKIPIVSGENRFTAYAFNHDNIKSSDATLVVTGADSLKRKGTAYILALGINQYATPGFNLKFAVPDADTFAKELSAQQAKLGTYANIEVIPLLDSEATKANFLLALDRLSGAKTGALPTDAPAAIAKIQPAQPEDAVIIYFAGHGYAAEEKDHKLFYLIMHEFEPVEVAAKVPGAVSDVELSEAVEKIDAGLLALLIDACQSGGALDSPDPRQGPMNSKGLAQLAYDKGMYILAAAQGNQAALEVNKLGHGLLTHALVGPQEGLSPAADLDKNGEVVLREWLDYATQRVPQLQEEKIEEAHKQGRSLTFFKGPSAASAPNASGAAARGDVSGGVQRPRVFYRREPEPQPPVIAKIEEKK